MRSLRGIPWRLLLVATLSACGAQAEDPSFGPPGGLRGKQAPSPSGGAAKDAGTAGDAKPLEAGPCTVSFKGQIHPLMTTGSWKCAQAGCHATGATPPTVTSDASATYGALTAQKRAGKPYVNAQSTDPADSYLLCNLKGEAGCGTQMPLVSGGAQLATAQELALVEAWIRCGAPNN